MSTETWKIRAEGSERRRHILRRGNSLCEGVGYLRSLQKGKLNTGLILTEPQNLYFKENFCNTLTLFYLYQFKTRRTMQVLGMFMKVGRYWTWMTWALSEVCWGAVFFLELFTDACVSKELQMGSSVEFTLPEKGLPVTQSSGPSVLRHE